MNLFAALCKGSIISTGKGANIYRSVQRSVINGNLLTKSIKVCIGGGELDVFIISLCNHLRIAAIKVHAHESRIGGGIALIIDASGSYIKGVYPVVCENFNHILGKGISAQTIIGRDIHKIDIAILVGRIPTVSYTHLTLPTKA